jgi:hypothetical protein
MLDRPLGCSFTCLSTPCHAHGHSFFRHLGRLLEQPLADIGFVESPNLLNSSLNAFRTDGEISLSCADTMLRMDGSSISIMFSMRSSDPTAFCKSNAAASVAGSTGASFIRHSVFAGAAAPSASAAEVRTENATRAVKL